jgi:hypothetical protein
LQSDTTHRSDKHKTSTAWSTFRVRALHLQAAHIEKHGQSHEHKRAMHLMTSPSSDAGRFTLQRNAEDESLLAGGVPQPADWLKAWSATQTLQSWQSLASHDLVLTFASLGRDRSIQASGMKAMLAVMHQVIRRRKLDLLASANFISLGFDDRKQYKIIRFRCDAAVFDSPSTEAGAHSGVLAIFNVMSGTTEEEFDEDYAIRGADKIEALLKTIIASGSGDAADESRWEHFCNHVTSLIVDKQLMKTCRALKARIFKRVVIISRDSAHAIRIAVKEPLVRGERFALIFNILFNDQHALLKDRL